MYGIGQGSCGREQQRVVVGPAQQRLAAALHVQGERAVDEHHQRAGLAGRLVPARLTLTMLMQRPGQRRAVRVGRVARGQHQHVIALFVLVVAGSVAALAAQ